tara:strand:+ start:287 stop:1279 length:993 start_codon:yes stop_codon:yes gene_type:complete
MKYILILITSFPLFANEFYLNFEQKFMDADWDFLPEVPSSFEQNNSESIEAGFIYKKIQGKIYTNEIELNLERATEPKNVTLNAKKDGGSIGYNIDDKNLVYISYANQVADPQVFSCYEFSGIILGGCDNASFIISSSNPKYDNLGSNIISINGDTDTFSIGYTRYINNFWLNSISFDITQTKYKYEWLSPIEDIQSPFLLNLTINGNNLGDAITDTLSRLPQRDEWKSYQFNLGLKQKFISIYNFNLIGEYDFVILNFENYQEYADTPKFNLKIRAGLEIDLKNISLTLYGDLYKNNLIGFEPITFNQRSEHYFDKAYGELGLILNFNF